MIVRSPNSWYDIPALWDLMNRPRSRGLHRWLPVTYNSKLYTQLPILGTSITEAKHGTTSQDTLEAAHKYNTYTRSVQLNSQFNDEYTISHFLTIYLAVWWKQLCYHHNVQHKKRSQKTTGQVGKAHNNARNKINLSHTDEKFKMHYSFLTDVVWHPSCTPEPCLKLAW